MARVSEYPPPSCSKVGGRRIGRRAQEKSRRKEEKKIEVMSEGRKIGRRGQETIEAIVRYGDRGIRQIWFFKQIIIIWIIIPLFALCSSTKSFEITNYQSKSNKMNFCKMDGKQFENSFFECSHHSKFSFITSPWFLYSLFDYFIFLFSSLFAHFGRTVTKFEGKGRRGWFAYC